MRAFFVQIKCDLGKAYDVATAIADSEIASEIYSTAGGWDLLVKLYNLDSSNAGHLAGEITARREEMMRRLYLYEKIRRYGIVVAKS